MVQVKKTVANSKLLVEETKNAMLKYDDGSKHTVQFAVKLPPIKGLTAKQAETFFNKCRQALALFKDDLVLSEIGVTVEREIPELQAIDEEFAVTKGRLAEQAREYSGQVQSYNEKIISTVHNAMIKKLNLEAKEEKAG